MPKDLLEIQDLLQTAVLNASHANTTMTLLTSSPTVDAHARLSIYQEAYRLRLIEALENDFPALKIYWGNERFNQEMLGYIENCQSMNPSLRWYGKELASYLETKGPVYSFAAELAAFEWAIGLAFDASDDTILTAKDLASLPSSAWQELGLQLHSSLRWISCKYNTADVWHALVNQEEMPCVEKMPDAHWLAIWRNQYKVRYRAISTLELEAISLFSKGEGFGNIIAQLSSTTLGDDAPNYLVTWLREWLSNEWISAVKIQ